MQHRGDSREALLKAVGQALPDVEGMVCPLAVLYMRELDGDLVLVRAEHALRKANVDPTGLRWSLQRYKARFATLGGEVDYGDLLPP